MPNNTMLETKYLFTVKYKDGTIYQQNPEDVSVTDPKRSCFYDVKQDEISTFTFRGENHEYLVSMEDGHFEIDGVPFFMHEDIREDLGNGRVKLIQLKDFRLIFYRQHKHEVRVSDRKELSHHIMFCIGWQCTVEGKNYQQIMHFS